MGFLQFTQNLLISIKYTTFILGYIYINNIKAVENLFEIPYISNILKLLLFYSIFYFIFQFFIFQLIMLLVYKIKVKINILIII